MINEWGQKVLAHLGLEMSIKCEEHGVNLRITRDWGMHCCKCGLFSHTKEGKKTHCKASEEKE